MAKVQAKLEAHTEKLWSLNEMERTGGEPDVVGLIKRRANTFFMIVQRNPKGRRSVLLRPRSAGVKEKNISREITLLIWLLPWALNF